MMKETSELVVLVARIANGVASSMEDGKITIGDLTNLGPALAALPAAISGISDIVVELKAATDADKEDLVNTFCAEFSISSAAAEALVEESIALVVGIWKLLSVAK